MKRTLPRSLALALLLAGCNISPVPTPNNTGVGGNGGNGGFGSADDAFTPPGEPGADTAGGGWAGLDAGGEDRGGFGGQDTAGATPDTTGAGGMDSAIWDVSGPSSDTGGGFEDAAPPWEDTEQTDSSDPGDCWPDDVLDGSDIWCWPQDPDGEYWPDGDEWPDDVDPWPSDVDPWPDDADPWADIFGDVDYEAVDI